MLQDLTPEMLLAMPPEALAALPQDYLQSLDPELQAQLAERLTTVEPEADLTSAAAQIKKEVDGLAEDTVALREVFATQQPEAQFVPENLQSLSAAGGTTAMPDMAKSAQRLADDLTALAAFAKAELPTATFIPKDIPLTGTATEVLSSLKEEATGLLAALNRLSADTSAESIHFLPQSLLEDSRAASLLSRFVSADGKSTRLTVVLNARPYSPEANADVESLTPVVAEAGKALGLQTAMGGTPVAMNDVEQVLDRDFIRIALLTLAGVFVVLALLLRSLVAPVYLVLTVLLSCGATLGLSTLIFQDALGHEGIGMVIPIVVFVLLVALGADYNIFLMSRVREEAEKHGTREGIPIASAYTGGIITSCGIILAGTFAALMVAPMQTFVQAGFTVAVGVLIDTFIIRAVLVPAIAALLGEWNWWPGKIKQR